MDKLNLLGAGREHAPEPSTYDQDVVVIGGGSGGMAFAKEAAHLGASVTLFDYVHPTAHGTKWGLGGTCVNVGCIPKKLMHKAGQLGHSLKHDFKPYGYANALTDNTTVDWDDLVSTVQSYIKSLNFSYRTGLRSAQVTYVNASAAFKDPHTIEYELKGEKKTLTARFIIVAVGGRPTVPKESDVPGASLAYTSDDLFSLPKPPGKTLIVGASYIALECAGFLNGCGFDVTVAVRSILLRGFDQQCAEKIRQTMEEFGVRFLHKTVLTKIEKTSEGKYKATYSNALFEPETFDTIVYAVGRRPATQRLNLAAANVAFEELTDKILVDEFDRTSTKHIFALGDNSRGRPELTPVAIKAGELLARRLFGKSNVLMDYRSIPTTVFTPVEYGCCGLSEEDAIAKYGAEDIEVFLFEYTPIEASAAHWEKVEVTRSDRYDTTISPLNMSKLVCQRSRQNKVLGFHCIAPNAGEITQGFAVALKAGLRKADLDETVGIHPTDAESFVSLTVTRRSGQDWVASGGCGGGRCG
eukprot:Gregarina_sp_Pseudo_9__5346@NODE_636_length_2443_cov_29_971298_g600_i0_p1_GENE_NODE_636_length_2443_cov_29_971298_g600_i0NODE_636_length_2443_cov_29_971298_g600_i0_p1_ORF_typecomplete_len526_score74_31Pyr_redox_2/PF07992_14/9_5e54Pyr_redox_dim/PF02852_22/2_6e25Pyr_redox/PF00070_27/0_00013Pyr_redox/PF00070_27/9_1e11Pyr_redox_3/PF13738_6/0_0095Pyr_redox_3/PF13738_6/3_4e13Pyr_redox_3/PF13738_6/32K_oxygenase/PF13434_6/2K_oxygenase/PF13434_6/4_4e08HI0933_like/PF03486_14/8_5e07HI0933_like/PF03486_14/3